MFSDYFPFGMAMPNRNNINNNYRYAYQGQEKDPETGKEAFELRLWDSRIGRWLTTDPAGQHHSPYQGMGNNPISQVDPDGAWHKDADGNLVADVGDVGGAVKDYSNIGGDIPSFDTSSLAEAGGFTSMLNLVDSYNTNIGYGNTAFGGLLTTSAVQNLAKVGDFPSNGVSVFNKSTRTLLRNLGTGSKILGTVGFGVSVGIDLVRAVPTEYGGTGEIGVGRFIYRSTVNYISLRSGIYGPIIYGAGRGAEFYYDASVKAQALRHGASTQGIHRGRIHNNNIFSKSFWNEVGGHFNTSGMSQIRY